MPGSPPSRMSEPGTSPPPSTRFTSLLPRSMRRWSLSRMSRTRCGREAGSPPASAEAGDELSRAMSSSVKVFHSPHEGQRPSHFGASKPQFLQKYAFLTLAMVVVCDAWVGRVMLSL